MNEQREIVKASWLQHVIRKKGGTLHRKKKIVYQDGKWVAFCIHNRRIPLLEWYFLEEHMHGHRPSKVIDLLDSSSVRVIMSDPSRRSFMIGFVDCSRDPIELSALTVEDCDDWIRSATSALIRLKCLPESTNLYISAHNFAFESSSTTEQDNDSNRGQVPGQLAFLLPTPAPRSSGYEHIRLSSVVAQPSEMPPLSRSMSIEEKKMKNNGMIKTPPPLPPRNIPSSKVQLPKVGEKRNSVYDNPKNRASALFGGSRSVDEHPENVSINPQNSVYSTLEMPISLDTEIVPVVRLFCEAVKRGYSVPAGTLNVSIPRSRRDTTNDLFSVDYDKPSGAINWISPIANIESQKKHSVSEQSGDEILTEGHNHSQIINNSGISSGLTNLAVQPFISMQHIAYVDFGGKVWITGWTAVVKKYLTGQLFVGDQLVRIEDVDIHSTQQIPFIRSAASKAGLSVNMVIQRVPYGIVYTLQKTKRNFEAGLVFDKHKIKLADVLEGSPAWEAGIRPTVPAVTRAGTTSACITSIDKHGLNMFSKDGDVFKYIDALPLSVFTVMVQPYDFVKILKRSLKKLKNVGDFIH